jgi:alkylation response protein AidB-like acyl-CoA dehydrogenase
MQIRVDAARLLIHRAVVNAETGLPSMLESSVAKCYANDIAREVCGHAVQLLGGYGYSREFHLERYARDVRVTSIYEGTSEIQRMIIAREILKSFS